MYKIKLWNNKYGKKAKFVIQDSKTGKFTEFSPERPSDVTWVDKDITGDASYKGWDDWKDEPVNDLSDIVM